MENKAHLRIIYVLGFLTAIGPFSIDAYIPGFPSIAQDLQTDIEHVTLSLTSYFIGISIGQLLYGPVLDRFGRKKPLLAGLAIYMASAIGCAFAPSIGLLIAYRFLLAIGGCVGMVASRAVVRDLFSAHETAKVFSMMMLVMGVAPILAPILGGFIVASAGWRYIFLLLLIVSAAMTFVINKYLPETKEADPAVSFHPFKLVSGYFSLFSNRTFFVYAVASGAASAALFSYISDSSFVFIQLFGIPEAYFGWIYGLNAMALVSASQFNRLWLSGRTSRQITIVTIILQFAASVILVASVILNVHHLIVMALIFFYLFWLGFLNPNTTSLALEPFKKNAGTASAMLGSMQMVFGAAASALVSLFHNGTALPMAAFLMIFSVLGLVAILYDRMKNLRLRKGE
ncbi:MAG: multidrug effflux MFS transporter [Ignavibacteria bacterium]|jgi:DHA1 family bicyclomycin/chloramphenicol resistance-like MFS transporter|nr:multidrug effflux MFS transporter [Ignavibacteria bacterium]MCU7502857.1 multidrug effflux MFS transporter [Ignavibacteria bacterium]MCU7515649.1 multidrug effflux MFS transporter [Ignavibacteria bacterium]